MLIPHSPSHGKVSSSLVCDGTGVPSSSTHQQWPRCMPLEEWHYVRLKKKKKKQILKGMESEYFTRWILNLGRFFLKGLYKWGEAERKTENDKSSCCSADSLCSQLLRLGERSVSYSQLLWSQTFRKLQWSAALSLLEIHAETECQCSRDAFHMTLQKQSHQSYRYMF